MYVHIKKLREDKKLRQQDIANILNITQQQYSKIEKGISDIKTDQLIKLSLFYNVSTDYILGIPKLPYPNR